MPRAKNGKAHNSDILDKLSETSFIAGISGTWACVPLCIQLAYNLGSPSLGGLTEDKIDVDIYLSHDLQTWADRYLPRDSG